MNPPSAEAVSALRMVAILEGQIRVLQKELIGTRRLAVAALGVASAAIGVAATLGFT